MLPRFFVPDLDPGRVEARLPAEEARHLTRVLRLGAGDEIAVFDGRGQEFRARVSSAERDVVRIALLAPLPAVAELRVPVTLAQAVLKGDKMDHVVRDATMMGVAAMVPLMTSRTVVPKRGARAAADRWTRVAIASTKQCRRAVVPVVSEPRRLEDWLAEDRADVRLVLVEPGAGDPGHDVHELRGLRLPGSASILAGPEGGWTPEEIHSAMGAGCLPVTFGGRTLRADAIAIVALSILQFLWGDL
jgi:16S rRNA (uracil1498-N3)-methyltransferase